MSTDSLAILVMVVVSVACWSAIVWTWRHRR